MNAQASTHALVTLCFALYSCGTGTIVRSHGGFLESGREISEPAYEAYGAARLLEVRGRLEEALEAYSAAADKDPAGSEARVRAGAVLCRLRRFEEAEAWLSQAERRLGQAPYRDRARAAELEFERAHCSLKNSDAAAARGHAERFAGLTQSTLAAAMLLKAIAEHAQHPDQADQYAREALLLDALADEHPFKMAGMPHRPPEATLAAVDNHLRDGDLDGALLGGRRIGWSPAQVMLRAAMLGQPQLVRDHAQRLQHADPSDVGAWVLASALGLEVRGAPTTQNEPIDDAALLLLGDALTEKLLVDLHGSASLRRTLAELLQIDSVRSDPLLERVRVRVLDRLADH